MYATLLATLDPRTRARIEKAHDPLIEDDALPARNDGIAVPVPSIAETHAAARTLAFRTVMAYRSRNTQRLYARKIEEFLQSGHSLTRIGVRTWLGEVRMRIVERPALKGDEILSHCLAAVKALARECAEHSVITADEAERIVTLKGGKVRAGMRLGNWLTEEQAHALYRAPDRGTTRGRRDAAIMALLLGMAIRREEATDLSWGQYTERDGRMILCDLLGKGAKIRSIAVPPYAQADLDAWEHELQRHGLAGPHDRVLRAVRPYDGNGAGIEAIGATLSPSMVWRIVRGYAAGLGCPEIAPHDLRRTSAHLMRDAGATVEQIAAVLGHASIVTTQRYLGSGVELRVGRAATDQVRL